MGTWLSGRSLCLGWAHGMETWGRAARGDLSVPGAATQPKSFPGSGRPQVGVLPNSHLCPFPGIFVDLELAEAAVQLRGRGQACGSPSQAGPGGPSATPTVISVLSDSLFPPKALQDPGPNVENTAAHSMLLWQKALNLLTERLSQGPDQ